MNILLTSAGRRTYLVNYFKDALRLAGRKGEVHAANSQVCPAFFAADRQVVTPLIYDPQYIPFLLEYCRRWQIELLIPLFDIDVPVLAAYRQAFAEIGCVVVTADPDKAEICNDKWKTYLFLMEHSELLSREGVGAPKTWLDVESAVQQAKDAAVQYPMIVKPRWGMGSLSIYQADDEEELRLFVKKGLREIGSSYLRYESARAPEHCALIQEKLQGQEYGLDVINDLDGRYRTTIVKRKAAMRSGETDAAETAENQQLKNLGRILGNLMKHRGNLDVDVFEANGQYYILEMNARFGGGYPFSHVAGIHLPYALVKWRAGEEPEPQYLEARAGVRAQKDIQILVEG